MNVRKNALLLLVTMSCLAGFSQSYIGYGYDNYSGVNSILLNPGMVADSRYKVNVNIFSASGFAGNNAYSMNRNKLLGLHFSNLEEGKDYFRANNSDYKYAYVNTDVLGPSAMINLSERNGLGLITRMRTIGNEYNLGNPLFQLLGNANPDYFNTNITNRSLQTKMMAFAEAGISFGRVLSKSPHSLLKVGITAKYIAGLGYASLSSGQMQVNISPSQGINQLNADVTAQYSANLDNLGNGGNISDALTKHAGKGWGMDLGMVYEWRPDGVADGDHSADQQGPLNSDPIPYKLRVGISITDLGSVNYVNSPNAGLYSMNAVGHNTAELEKKDGESYDQYITRMKTDGLIVAKGAASAINVKLPAALHLNADWHIYKRFFVDGDILLNTIANTNTVSPNYVTSFTVTPRMEKKWVSIYSPFSYNVQGQMNWGAGFRMGPVFAGSGSILSTLLTNRIKAADVHVGITIPIYRAKSTKENKESKKTDTLYKKVLISNDRDGDGVVDAKDECPDSAGPIALIGCPDRDGDGVPNYRDSCPDVKGSPNFHGCPAPDSDGDGVNDDDDKCPLVKGLVSNHGCPPIRPEVIRSVNRAADRIFFVRAKAVIEKNCYPELDRVVQVLKADSTLHLHIEGHTDSEGTDARNQSLSRRRARAVLEYLESHGIPAGRMDTEAYGSKHPLASNETAEGMAQNRRVEMVLTNWK